MSKFPLKPNPPYIPDLYIIPAKDEMNSSNNSNGWISVKERLPRPGQEVLAFDNGIVRVKAISTQNEWHPYINGSNCDPSHWMPLPKPPEDK